MGWTRHVVALAPRMLSFVPLGSSVVLPCRIALLVWAGSSRTDEIEARTASCEYVDVTAVAAVAPLDETYTTGMVGVGKGSRSVRRSRSRPCAEIKCARPMRPKIEDRTMIVEVGHRLMLNYASRQDHSYTSLKRVLESHPVHQFSSAQHR